MKRLFYIFISALLFIACSDETTIPNSDVKEGDEVTLTVSINAPEQPVLETRALGEMTDNIQKNLNLWLLVFDENGIFVQAAIATPGDNTSHRINGVDHTDTEFTVTLNATSAQRIIHFIAYDGNAGAGVGAILNSIQNQFGTESSMMQQLYTEGAQAAYWQRQIVNGITNETIFECVPLVRNFSKITIGVESGVNFTISGYTVVNAPSRGAVAPYYSGSFIDYVNNTTKTNKSYDDLSSYPGTAPSGTTYSTSQTLTTTGSLYLYETPNAAGDDKGRTSVIIKGHAGNASDSFYKVDLVYSNAQDESAGNLYYNILRNFEYKVTIGEVTGSGYSSLASAIAGAASNNLSASTATSTLSRISDGVQMMEVSNVYYCFTEGGVQTVLKYCFRYKNGNNWVTDNSLVRVKTDNDDIFTSGGWTVATTDDTSGEYAGWRTITMNLKDPVAQPLTSIFHIYVSPSAINASNLSQALKNTLTAGEQLYRDVRVDVRQKYRFLVDCPPYVPGSINQKVLVYLLIPQSVNEALFPMDFYLEPEKKSIDPDVSQVTNPDLPIDVVKMPVHVGQSIVEGVTTSSFQYARTVTKEVYASLGTKTVGGITYKMVPCYFKTTIADNATKVFAGNEYFEIAYDEFMNVPAAFMDNSGLTIASDYTEYFGKNYPVNLTYYVTSEAYQRGTTFNISVTEGGTTSTATQTPNNANPVTVTEGGVTTTCYKQVYTYYTKTINDGASITATVSATIDPNRGEESHNTTLAMNRRYFVIKAYSFTTNITDYLDGATGDGSSIYISGTNVGWFGRGLTNSEDGYLTNDGPRQDYIIDRSYQNYQTLNASDEVMFKVYNPNRTITATTTIGDLDDARIRRENNPSATPTLNVTFSEQQ